ncbi:MAG: hypothetical protein QXT05_03215 [Candidatus Bilamarchaeaceae archaeon]
MLSNWLAIFKEEVKKAPEEEKKKTGTFQEFLKDPEVVKFSNEWNKKIEKATGLTGRALINEILWLAYTHQALESNEAVIKATRIVLRGFVGEERAENVAKRLKAAPEKLIKEAKSLVESAIKTLKGG